MFLKTKIPKAQEKGSILGASEETESLLLLTKKLLEITQHAQCLMHAWVHNLTHSWRELYSQESSMVQVESFCQEIQNCSTVCGIHNLQSSHLGKNSRWILSLPYPIQ